MDKKKPHKIFSVLSTMLVISKWSLWFIIVTAPLALFDTPLFPLQFGSNPADVDAKWPTFFVGLMLEDDMSRAAFVLDTAIAMLLSAVGLYIIHHLRRILANVQKGAAFVRENGVWLRRIGYGAAAGQLAVYALWIISGVLDAVGLFEFEGRVIAITPAPWLGILGAFALSTIFLEGAEIKEEQDLTV